MMPVERKPGWQYWEIADLIRDGAIEIGDGYRAKNSEMGTSGFPFARAGNLNGGFHFEDADILCEDSVRRAGEKVSRPGDITFTSKGTFGRFAFIGRNTPKFVYSPQLCYWRVKREGFVDRRFLYYWMQSADCMNQLVQVKGLTDMADYVSLTNQRKMWLSAPPLPVQLRIAGILSTYDDLIENNQRRIRILEEMARALYREWFVHFRFPGHETVPRGTSVLGPIPRGWEIAAIDDVCERVTDGSHSSPKSVPQGLPMASSKDMHDWGLNLDACRHISWEDYEKLVRNGCKPSKGDVLITKDGANYLKHIFVMHEELEIVLLSSIAILRPNGRINPHLLSAILTFPDNKERLKRYVTGAAIPRIILKDFKRFEIVVPPLGIQQAWAKAAEPVTELCWNLIDRNHNLRCMRDMLLPQLFAGKLLSEPGYA